MPFPVENIDSACKKRGITIAELERRLHIGNGVIRRWKDAVGTPPIDRIYSIANILGVSVEYLMTGQEKAPTEDGGRKRAELIRLFDAASPELQAAALAVLRSGESRAKAPDAGPTDK